MSSSQFVCLTKCLLTCKSCVDKYLMHTSPTQTLCWWCVQQIFVNARFASQLHFPLSLNNYGRPKKNWKLDKLDQWLCQPQQQDRTARPGEKPDKMTQLQSETIHMSSVETICSHYLPSTGYSACWFQLAEHCPRAFCSRGISPGGFTASYKWNCSANLR